MKKLAVIGTGGVGGYFGAKLLKAGFDVVFVATKKSAEIISKNGLKISSPSGDMEFKEVKVTSDYSFIKDCDVIFLCTKSQNTKEVGEGIKPYMKQGAIIVSLQNGIENEEILSEILGAERVIPAQIYISVASYSAGMIEHGGSGEIVIGELDNQTTDRLRELQNLLMSADIPTKITNDYRKILWLKLLVNSVYNGFSAILGDDFKKIPFSVAGKTAFYEMLKEGQRVANADGVNIEEKHLQKITEMTEEGNVFFNYPSSTLQDVKKHKPLEIDYIQGAIIRKGKKYNIETPMNELIWSLLKIKEQG
ncbi:2-dehydropantoate 2-reductase [bacterium]|nr:2-dehydropantoate 2-reductase [bacterium]